MVGIQTREEPALMAAVVRAGVALYSARFGGSICPVLPRCLHRGRPSCHYATSAEVQFAS